MILSLYGLFAIFNQESKYQTDLIGIIGDGASQTQHL